MTLRETFPLFDVIALAAFSFVLGLLVAGWPRLMRLLEEGFSSKPRFPEAEGEPLRVRPRVQEKLAAQFGNASVAQMQLVAELAKSVAPTPREPVYEYLSGQSIHRLTLTDGRTFYSRGGVIWHHADGSRVFSSIEGGLESIARECEMKAKIAKAEKPAARPDSLGIVTKANP